MAWGKKPPKKEGYYWVKANGIFSGKEYIHPVRVYKSNNNLEVPNTIFSDGENFSIKNCDMFSEWWDKPIEMPMDKEFE
jgi:hypothetical protein